VGVGHATWRVKHPRWGGPFSAPVLIILMVTAGYKLCGQASPRDDRKFLYHPPDIHLCSMQSRLRSARMALLMWPLLPLHGQPVVEGACPLPTDHPAPKGTPKPCFSARPQICVSEDTQIRVCRANGTVALIIYPDLQGLPCIQHPIALRANWTTLIKNGDSTGIRHAR